MEGSNYYRILQVDPTAELEVIEAAYRRLAQKYHPDTNPSPTAVRHMQEINRAYEVLRNVDTRTAYDRQHGVRDGRSEATARHRHAAARLAWRQAEQERSRRAQASVRPRQAWWIVGLACVALIVGVATVVAIVHPSWTASQQQAAPVWKGEWSTPAGYLYTSRLKAELSPMNIVRGSIVLTLSKGRPHPDDHLKLGQKARVYVKGTFDPQSRRMTMQSYDQEDPYDVLDMNTFSLSLSLDGEALSGEVHADGVRQGTLSAVRTK